MMENQGVPASAPYSQNPPPYPQGQGQYPHGSSPYPQIPTNGFNEPTMSQPQPGSTTVVMPQGQPQVVIIGGCPTCKQGVLEDSYGCCAICLAICCFPVGLVCCYLMRERKCTNCGAIIGS